MITNEIIRHRLINQQIAETRYTKPEDIVSHLGAMQSQDWHMAKWAIGLRLPGSKENDVESAFNEGRILRPHILRPTWHFLAPKDIRWMQQLTSHRVQAFNATYYRKFGLDQKFFKKCNTILIGALRDHNYLTRNELAELLNQKKITPDGITMSYIMMNAELEGLICSGPRKGKQFTYALMEEKSTDVPSLKKDEALHKLVSLYFDTRGPATINDFTWWSGLTVKEAKEGIGTLGKNYLNETIDGKEYILYDRPVKDVSKLQTSFLVPDYDEYGISYKDRSIYNHPKTKQTESKGSAYYVHAITVDGFLGGYWGRPTDKNKSSIEVSPFSTLTKKQLASIKNAVKSYQSFFK